MQAADVGLATLLKRDRVVVATALMILTLLAWAYVLWLSAHMATPAAVPTAGTPGAMTGMDTGAGASPDAGMAGMDMSGMAGAIAPAFRAWAPADFAFMFAMWSVMMVGMMTPSVAPMVLLYAGVGRKAAESGAPFASTGWFFAGYLFVWIAFSALATFAQWALTALALLTPVMVAASPIFGGILLVAVGLYQLTPFRGRHTICSKSYAKLKTLIDQRLSQTIVCAWESAERQILTIFLSQPSFETSPKGKGHLHGLLACDFEQIVW